MKSYEERFVRQGLPSLSSKRDKQSFLYNCVNEENNMSLAKFLYVMMVVLLIFLSLTHSLIHYFTISLFHSFTHSLSHSLTRLGISRASLSSHTLQYLFYGILYFVVAFWDAYSMRYLAKADSLETIRLVFISSVDAVIYFSIFKNLSDTMNELQEKKQNAKLEIFTKLRNLLIVSIFTAAVTLIVFSYIVVNELSQAIWKYQWL